MNVIIFLLAIVIPGSAFAQENKLNIAEINKPGFNNDSSKVRLINLPEQGDEDGVKRTPLTGKLLGENEKGDRIYAMSTDNMPCLVPGKSFNSKMPVSGFGIQGKRFKSPFKPGRKRLPIPKPPVNQVN